jgi:hypothetical protein
MKDWCMGTDPQELILNITTLLSSKNTCVSGGDSYDNIVFIPNTDILGALYHRAFIVYVISE